MQIPADPQAPAKEPKQVAPVQFLNPERYRPEVPEGTVHPSQNKSHSITNFHSDQEVLTRPADTPSDLDEDEDEPTESDLEPLLVDADPNALKGNLSDE